MMTAFLILLAACAYARPESEAADIAWVASGEFCEPETVLPLPDDTLLVSNVCDFREGGNGFLSLLDARGQPLDWRIVEGLDAPLGMALTDDRLYVVDNNRLRVFRWPGYEPLEVIDVETTVANTVETLGPVWLSDIDGIEFEQDGTLQVTPVAGPLIRYGERVTSRFWAAMVSAARITATRQAWGSH